MVRGVNSLIQEILLQFGAQLAIDICCEQILLWLIATNGNAK